MLIGGKTLRPVFLYDIAGRNDPGSGTMMKVFPLEEDCSSQQQVQRPRPLCRKSFAIMDGEFSALSSFLEGAVKLL